MTRDSTVRVESSAHYNLWMFGFGGLVGLHGGLLYERSLPSLPPHDAVDGFTPLLVDARVRRDVLMRTFCEKQVLLVDPGGLGGGEPQAAYWALVTDGRESIGLAASELPRRAVDMGITLQEAICWYVQYPLVFDHGYRMRLLGTWTPGFPFVTIGMSKERPQYLSIIGDDGLAHPNIGTPRKRRYLSPYPPAPGA